MRLKNKLALMAVLLLCSACGAGEDEAFRMSRWMKNPLPQDFNSYPRDIQRNWQNYKVGTPYRIGGQWFIPKEEPHYRKVGIASWYGSEFHNKRTANGEIFNKRDLTAAHRTLPLPSVVRVTNLENGRSALLRVNDRGPYVDTHERIIDVSEAAAKELGFREKGKVKVRVEYDREETARLFYPDGHKPITVAGAVPEYTLRGGEVEPKSGTYFVQAGAYSTRNGAYVEAMQLRRIHRTKIEAVDLAGKQLYRVKLGPFKDVRVADKVLNQVAGVGYQDAIITFD